MWRESWCAVCGVVAPAAPSEFSSLSAAATAKCAKSLSNVVFGLSLAPEIYVASVHWGKILEYLLGGIGIFLHVHSLCTHGALWRCIHTNGGAGESMREGERERKL